MLKILERSITIQLLIFYCLFLFPLLIGGGELYLFQRDTLQQSTQRTDLGIAQGIALNVKTTIQATAEHIMELAKSEWSRHFDMPQLSALFTLTKGTYTNINGYFVCDSLGHLRLRYPTDYTKNSPCTYLALSDVFKSNKILLSRTASGAISSQTPTITLATRITGPQGQAIGILGCSLSLAQLTAHVVAIQHQLTTHSEVQIWIIDRAGQALISTEQRTAQTEPHLPISILKQAIRDKQGNITAHEQGHDWLLSYLPIEETPWVVIIQRPTDITFVATITFQNSLLLALVTLIIGATFFWFVLHGWVVAPLSRLARAVSMIRPDQVEHATTDDLLIRDRSRSDEIGQLIAAFSTMEEEIHTLFRQSDEQSQARLHTLDAIMRSMDEGVLLERPNGHIIYANQSFTQFVGITAQDYIQGDTLSERGIEARLLALIENPKAYYEGIRQFEHSHGSHTFEFQVRGYYNQAGQLVTGHRDIRIRLFQVRDQAGQIIGRGKIFRDVTRQNEAEQIKKNLLAVASHELRTPLTTIKGYATSLLETDVELDDALQRQFLQRIVEEGDRMAELVTNILEMSQLEAGTLKLSLSPQHLETLIDRVINAEEPTTIQKQIASNIPLLYVDQRRIEAVLRNLLENARCYAGAEAVIEIVAGYKHVNKGLYLSVVDNGPGLPAHLTEQIFDRFYQIEGGRQRSKGGVGLGLAICRGFIEAHGGRIWAENRTDGESGAIFHIWLPPTVFYTSETEAGAFELRNVL